jgi:fibronectin-binding autotransporter adhesin
MKLPVFDASSSFLPVSKSNKTARRGRGRRVQSGRAVALLVASLMAAAWPAVAAETIVLGAAQNLTILGGSTVTNTGATIITGNLGLSPGSSVTGFPPGAIVNGAIHINDALAVQGHADAFTAYNQLAGEMLDTNLTGMDLGGLTLTPGVYRFNTSAQLTGTLRLDTQGDPNAAFHFQIGSTLTTATASAVVLLGLNGGTNSNIFWQVGSSATIGSATAFDGTILALTSITFNSGAGINAGRALAINGAVTLDTNNIRGIAAPVVPGGGTFWNGQNSNLWSGANWSPTAAGATTDTLDSGADVVFSVTGITPQNQNTTLDIDVAISSLTVNDPSAVTISGPGTLAIFGAGARRGITINGGAGLTTINSNVELSGLSNLVTVNNLLGLLISGQVSGTVGLTKAGSGQLTLTAAETYTGSTVVQAGTLQLGNGLIAGSSIAAASPISVQNGGTFALNLRDGETFANAVADDGVFTTIASGVNTVSGVISGAGALTQNGTGTAILTGANTYAGATTVQQGTLQIGNGATGSISGASPVTVSAGTLALNLGNGGTFANNVANAGLVTTIAAGTNTLSGVTSGTGALTQNGIGTSILTGANTYTGATTVLRGTLQIGNGATGSISAASPVSVTGGILAVNLANGGILANNIANSSLVTTIASGTNTLSGVTSGTGALTQNGTGTSILTGANTYTGATNVLQGTLQIGNGTSGSISAATPVTVTGGTLALNLANGGIFTNNIANSSLVTTIASGTNTLSGVTSGTGALTQNGTGTSILTGANTYTGATTVLQGTLQIGNGQTGSISANSAVAVSAGTLALNLVNGGTFSNDVANGGLVTTIASGTNTLSGVMSGRGAFTQTGTGLTILTGANTYTGATTVLRGTLRAGAANVVPARSALRVNTGARFDLASLPQSVGSVADGPAGGGAITLGTAELTTGNDNTNTRFSGIISGSGPVTKRGTGTWTLAGANSYTGATTVAQGAIRAGAANVISKSSPVAVRSGALFNLAGFAQSIGSLSGGGRVQLGSARLETGNDNTDTVFSGVISGPGTLRKIGAGTWELTGENTATGLTTVAGGTLAVNGSIAGDALVSRGLLRGVGRIGGNLVNNAQVSPGRASGPGTLSVGGNYDQSAAGAFNVRLASPTVNDRLVVGGAARLNGTLNVSYVNGFNAKPGDVFTIITTRQGVSGEFATFNDPHATGTLLTLGVTYEERNVLLEFGQGSFEDLVSNGPCSVNKLAVAVALDKLAADEPLHEVILDLDTLPLAQVPDALTLLSPDDLANIFTAGLAVSQVQVGNIERRLQEVRLGATGFSDSGFAVSDSHGGRNYDGKSAVGTDPKGGKTFAPVADDQRWGFFISGSGSIGDLDNTCYARGSSFATGGVTIGGDYRVSDHFVLGAAIGYANTSSDLSRGGDLQIDSGKGSIYGSYYNSGFYVNGIVGAGYGSFDTKRRTLGGFAHGETEGIDFNSLLGVGYDHHIGGFTIGPVASLQYSRLSTDSFDERGALGALRIDSQSQDSLKTALGVRAAYTAKVGRVILTPQVRAQWQHEFLEDESSIDARFNGGDSFTVRGPNIGRDALLLDVGLAAQLTETVAVFAFYTGEIGRENYTVHSINGGVRVSF